MYIYYLKMAYRIMLKRKVYSIINIGSMALGLTVCLLAIFWILDEVGYDAFHENAPYISQVYCEIKTSDGHEQVFTGSFYPLAQELRERLPEVAAASRFETTSGLTLRAGENSFSEDVIALVDSSFFTIFSFPFLKGGPGSALKNRNSIVLTESMSRKYFGDEDPLGKTMNVEGAFDLIVTGILSDVPRQSSLQFAALVPFVLQFAPTFKEPAHWGGNPFQTFILTHRAVRKQEMAGRINETTAAHFQNTGSRVDFRLLPLTSKRLHDPDMAMAPILLLFAGVALAVLLVACVNFANLSTAMAVTRAKEIAVRTTVGAQRTDLIAQFLGESLLISFFSFLIALGLLYLILPTFNQVAGTALSLQGMANPWVPFAFLAVTLLTAVIAGSYPAFYLTRFQPHAIIKSAGTVQTPGLRGRRLRKSLVVFQFALSVILILATMTVSRQMQYIKKADLGFDQHNLISIPVGNKMAGQFATLKTELERNSAIISVTAGCQNPMNISSSVSAVDWEGKRTNGAYSMHFDWIDYDYFETLEVPIVAGRGFSEAFPADEKDGYVVNESAVRMMGMSDPIGQSLTVFKNKGRIVGVVKDFHYRPLYHQIRPIVFILKRSVISNVFIRINPASTTEALHHIETVMQKMDPEKAATLRLRFFDDELIASQYAMEKKIQRSALLFTTLAILIACAGLFGLAAFLTEQRTREVGIRKILGASRVQLSVMLSREFSKWVLLANVFAWPAAYFIIRQMLAIYAYHTHMGIEFYILTGCATFVIAGLTVGLLTLKTASRHPVTALRYE